MQKIKVGINGLGRIGRAFLKLAINRPEIEIVAVNDLGDPENLAYLLKYDTVYGKSDLRVEASSDSINVNGKKIAFSREKEPSKIPWGEAGVDIVVESTGFFEDYTKARAHLDGGAKRVVITAPAKGEGEGLIGNTVLMGINEDKLQACQVSSNASCTTNAGSPVMQILNEAIGIEKAVLNTVHAYTATQRIVDGPDERDFRRGRAGAQNIVPSTTGAAIAVTKAVTGLKGKFDGIAIRVPVVAGSIADITFISSRNTTTEEVNEILKNAAEEERWKNIFAVTEEEVVSSDIIGDTHASIADLSFTKVVGGNLVKVLAWYDNETGYANTLVEHVIKAGEYL
ncbi:MAG: type I glyceraldehyde-3-phosphate dehydrogenase [Candidatus Paceibacterota bacterium]|jgi:glyceraldehyde 3-phosphate dehydrogenase